MAHDVDLPADFDQDAGPLTALRLFELVAEEAFRDAKIEEREKEILLKLARFLRLTNEEARGAVGSAKAKCDAGQLGSTRPFDPDALYETVLIEVMADGTMDVRENQMVIGLRKLFSISDEKHCALLERVLLPDGLSRSMLAVARKR